MPFSLSLLSCWALPPEAPLQKSWARIRFSQLSEASPLGAAYPGCEGQGMLGTLPQG